MVMSVRSSVSEKKRGLVSRIRRDLDGGEGRNVLKMSFSIGVSM